MAVVDSNFDEWRKLEEEARTRLRTQASDIQGYRLITRVVTLASFEDCWSCTVFHPLRNETASFKVERLVWRRVTDQQKFRTPVERLKHGWPLAPTFERFEIDVPVPRMMALLDRVLQSSVPPYVLEHSFGVDGTSYEVDFGQTLLTSHFSWWSNPPKGWEPLQELVEGVSKLFDEEVKNPRQTRY